MDFFLFSSLFVFGFASKTTVKCSDPYLILWNVIRIEQSIALMLYLIRSYYHGREIS